MAIESMGGYREFTRATSVADCPVADEHLREQRTCTGKNLISVRGLPPPELIRTTALTDDRPAEWSARACTLSAVREKLDLGQGFSRACPRESFSSTACLSPLATPDTDRLLPRPCSLPIQRAGVFSRKHTAKSDTPPPRRSRSRAAAKHERDHHRLAPMALLSVQESGNASLTHS